MNHRVIKQFVLVFCIASLTEAGDPNIVATWKFDEGVGTTAYDSAGSNHGTLLNGPTWTSGKIAGTLQFDGVDDYVEIANSRSLQLTNAITVVAWAKAYSFDIWRSIVSKDQSGSNEFWFGYNTTNRLDFKFNGQGGKNIDSNTVITDFDWHHLVGVYDGNDIYVFVDGILDSTPIIYSDINDNTGSINIAYTKYWKCCRFDGLIDEVSIYNRALTEDEIYDIYLAGLVKYTISGRVTFGDSGLANVNMVGLGVITNANGNYSAQVDPGWSATVTPTKAEYTFNPNSRTYTNVTSNQTNEDYAVTTLAAPTITSTPLTIAAVGQPYSYNVDANGFPGPSYSLITSPAGMEINSITGLIQWVADVNQIGDVNVAVEANNIVNYDRQIFSITVLPSDNFNDNRRNAMWQLFVEDRKNTWIVENANRLELRATGNVNDLVALYIANGWSLNVNEDFAVEVDFHYSGISEQDAWIGVTIGNINSYVSISAGSSNDELHFYYEAVVDGNTLFEQEPRYSNDGKFYISYDAESNNVYLSHIGYGDANAYNWKTIPYPLQVRWTPTVGVAIGGSSNGVSLDPGKAYLDNLKIFSAKLIGRPPITHEMIDP